jgi:hypothetical protein
MNAIVYPVAPNAEAALHTPAGHAAREQGAERLAGGPVEFVSEAVGPAFDTREAALDAYAGRVEDDRPGRPGVPPEARWCTLRPVIDPQAGRRKHRRPVQPVNRDGRRWPEPDPEAKAALRWRLSVSYWRVRGTDPGEPLSPARALRRDRAQGPELDNRALHRLATQPLRPVKPQQPLDIGLFEVRPPEAPHILMPDE